MNISSLITRINKHLQLIATEEENVDKKRIILVSQRSIDTKTLFESIAMPQFNFSSLNQFLKQNMTTNLSIAFCINLLDLRDLQWTMRSKSELYFSFLNFIMPCEDDDQYQITKNKEHLGGARTIFNLHTSEALYNLFYAEVHYHFEIERSKKELFRDFEFGLSMHPLCDHKYVVKNQLEDFGLNDQQINRVWRRLNLMQRKEYINENYKCKHFKSILFPEDYIEHIKLVGRPVQLDEQVLNQFQKPRQYAKNTRKEAFIECPKNDSCQFYQNYDLQKNYNGDKFMVEYHKAYLN